MNKNIILGGIVIVIIIAFIVLSKTSKEEPVLNTDNDLSESEIQEPVTENTTSTDVSEDTNTKEEGAGEVKEKVAGPGSYEAYTSAKLAFAETGDVVLFFHAAWCPTCRSLENNINQNLQNIPGGVRILKVDFDNSKELRQKYGATTQHTLVQVDKDGNMISKWSGSPTLVSLVAQIQ